MNILNAIVMKMHILNAMLINIMPSEQLLG